MFRESLTYPRIGDDSRKTIVIGGAMALLSFLILPAVVLAGYYVQVVRSVRDGQVDPPTFDDWERLFGDGLRAILVIILYGIVPTMLVALAGIFGAMAGVVALAPDGAATNLAAVGVLGVVAGLFALAALLVGLVVWYVLPAALVTYVAEGSVRAAFDVGALRSIVTTGSYAEAWLLALVVFLLSSVITGILSATVIAAILTPWVGFYAAVAATYLYAHGVLESGGDGHQDEPAGVLAD
ncbi:DUF4013 domain-containing protein [Halobacteriales archaeon Cl-PHB]